MDMKNIYVTIISVAAALLAASPSRAERGLDALWPSRFKEGSNESHEGEGLMARLSVTFRESKSNVRRTVRGNCLDGLLSKQYSLFLRGRGVGIPYYQFRGEGDLYSGGTVDGNGWVTGGTVIGRFQLALGQSTLLVGGARQPMGRITLIFNNGTMRTFSLPDSLAISDSSASINGPLVNASTTITLYQWYVEGATAPL